jgi:uncharacterized protein YjeT (DUF2065 family)
MTIILYIKNLFLKLLNFLLGKTVFFITILAWFLIITGALFLWRPERARRKLTGMGFGPAKWILLIAIIYVAGILIALSGKLSGILALILLITVIIGSIKVYFLLKKKLYKKFVEWFAKVPIKHLKIFAVIQIAIGCLMLILRSRIWF